MSGLKPLPQGAVHFAGATVLAMFRKGGLLPAGASAPDAAG